MYAHRNDRHTACLLNGNFKVHVVVFPPAKKVDFLLYTEVVKSLATLLYIYVKSYLIPNITLPNSEGTSFKILTASRIVNFF